MLFFYQNLILISNSTSSSLKTKQDAKPFYQPEGKRENPIAFYRTTTEFAALFTIQMCIGRVIKQTDHVSELFSLPDKNAGLYLPISLCRQGSSAEQDIRITQLMRGSALSCGL